MKKLHLFLAAIAIAVAALISPDAASAAPRSQASKTQKESTYLLSKIPANLIIEQKATLGNGRSVTVYYRKSCDKCELYSADNLTGYTADDLLSLESTSFRRVSEVKGRLVYSCPLSKARSLIKQLVNTYL